MNPAIIAALAADQILVNLIGPVISIVGLLLAARYLAGRQAEAVKNLTEDVAKLTDAMDSQAKDLAATRAERYACALDAARRYASHAEVGAVLAEQAASAARTEEKIDGGMSGLHGRVTELAKQVSRIAGVMEGRKESGSAG